MADEIPKVEPAPAVTKNNIPPLDGFEFQLDNIFGKELAAKDIGGKSDPYILIGFIGDEDVALNKSKAKDEEGGIFYKSEVTKKSLKFHAPKVMAQPMKLKKFKIEIWDKDSVGADDWMGSFIVEPQLLIDTWFDTTRGKWGASSTIAVNNLQIQQGVKSGKVSGSLSFTVKLTHPKVQEYVKMEEDYAVYQNKVRLAEAKEKKRLEEEKAAKEKAEADEKRRKKKEEADKKAAERKAAHLEKIPGQFEAVVDAPTFLKFADRSTAARSWDWPSDKWDDLESIMTKKEVVNLVGPEKVTKVLAFAICDVADFKLDLFHCVLGYIFGLMQIVDFSETPEFSKLLGLIHGMLVKNANNLKCATHVEAIKIKLQRKMHEDENFKAIGKFLDERVFTPAEKEAIDKGWTPKQAWDTDVEPIRRIGNIPFRHLENWKPEHARLLKDTMVYIRTKAIKNMGDSDFWDEVGRYCIDLEKKKHAGIDEVMKDRDAFLVVDGIGVNFRCLHIFKKDLMPLKNIYQPKGRWHFSAAKDYTRGGWQYITA